MTPTKCAICSRKTSYYIVLKSRDTIYDSVSDFFICDNCFCGFPTDLAKRIHKMQIIPDYVFVNDVIKIMKKYRKMKIQFNLNSDFCIWNRTLEEFSVTDIMSDLYNYIKSHKKDHLYLFENGTERDIEKILNNY